MGWIANYPQNYRIYNKKLNQKGRKIAKGTSPSNKKLYFSAKFSRKPQFCATFHTSPDFKDFYL